jgi:intein-encoded DNA endonuclease-like protein
VASRLDVVDSLTGGRLARRVSQLRGEGLSFELIAEQIRTEFGIPTTAASVRRWWIALDDNQPTPLPRRGRRSA